MTVTPDQHEPTTTELDEIELDHAATPDRLPPMLFLAALIHGILIIGITFNAAITAPQSDSVSLEVTIVADPERSTRRDDDAEYLAQASQEGGGNTDQAVRPGAPLKSNVPIDNIGDLYAQALRDTRRQEMTANEVLTTRAAESQLVTDKPRELPQEAEARAAYLEAGVETTLPLPQDDDANFQVRDQNRRQLVLSADTRESSIAGYVDRWKRKIETVGSKFIPEQAGLRGLSGSPTLEVTIDASGRLADVVIIRSSGSRVLDQAALSILRRASPFDPFPPAVRVDYPQLNFLYKWRFAELATTTARSD